MVIVAFNLMMINTRQIIQNIKLLREYRIIIHVLLFDTYNQGLKLAVAFASGLGTFASKDKNTH